MIIKPKLSNAKIFRDEDSVESMRAKGIPENIIKFVLQREGKELNSEDLGIGAKFRILGLSDDTNYHAFKTEGTSEHLSFFKLVGGCNNLSAFDVDGAEKSEDYDSLSADKIIDLSSDYEDVERYVLGKYRGRSLRVVARSASGQTQYGGRYYLFALDD
jgi:hypothetical protein